MKRLLIFILAFVLLTVPVSASGNLVNGGEEFLPYEEVAAQVLGENAVDYAAAEGFSSGIRNQSKSYGKTIAISMGVGLLIGLLAVGVMASMMKSVRSQNGASDYVRHGSMHLTNQRDIFLYSHVTRTPRPKSNSTGSSGNRGGAGGRM